MKNVFFILIGTGILLFVNCKNNAPDIADITEISATTLHETFVCQPIQKNEELISIIYKNYQAELCSYIPNDKNSDYNWEHVIEQYGFGGGSPINAPIIDLQENDQGQLFMNLFRPGNNPYIKSVKFRTTGEFEWQLTDSIHQPDTIYFGIDTVDLVTKHFSLGGLVNLSDGGVKAISTIDSIGIDSTFLQISSYDVDGVHASDTIIKMLGSWQVNNTYFTSDDNILLITDRRGTNNSDFKLIDLDGNILFNFQTNKFIIETFFFYENNDGNYLISCSYLEGSNLAHGITYCIDNSGNQIWELNSDIQNTGGLLLSVNEQADGYLFNGVKTSSAIFDWRYDFDEYDYQAFIMKTDKNGNILWENNDLFNNTYFKSAAAGTIINNNLNLYISRDDGPIVNVSILKLDNEGNIIN